MSSDKRVALGNLIDTFRLPQRSLSFRMYVNTELQTQYFLIQKEKYKHYNTKIQIKRGNSYKK